MILSKQAVRKLQKDIKDPVKSKERADIVHKATKMRDKDIEVAKRKKQIAEKMSGPTYRAARQSHTGDYYYNKAKK